MSNLNASKQQRVLLREEILIFFIKGKPTLLKSIQDRLPYLAGELMNSATINFLSYKWCS